MTKPSSTAPGWIRGLAIRSPSLREAIGEKGRQTIVADTPGREFDIIGHAAIGHFPRLRVEGEETGRRIVIARLADGTGDHKPLPAPEELHGDTRGRQKRRHFAGD